MPQENSNHSRIAINTTTGTVFITEKEIMYCEAQGSYTYIYLNQPNNKKLIISKPLNAIIAALNSKGIIRIHKSFAANLLYIKQYKGIPQNCITMSSGATLSVSRAHKKAFMNYFKVI